MDALLSFLPKTGLRAQFAQGIDEALRVHVGEGAAWHLETVATMTRGACVRAIPSTPVLVALGCVPAQKKAYLLIDHMLAQAAIERLLGGSSEEARVPRALSDTEEGVLQYLLLQLMAHVYRCCGASSRVHFRFDGFAHHADELMQEGAVEDKVSILTFRVELGSDVGFVKLIMPDPLVEAALLNVESPLDLRPEERAYELEELKRFGHFRTPLWAEAGRTTLMPGELVELERDDVILFDESDLVLASDGAISGRVLVRVGTGMSGGFIAEVEADEKSVHARLNDVFKGEHL